MTSGDVCLGEIRRISLRTGCTYMVACRPRPRPRDRPVSEDFPAKRIPLLLYGVPASAKPLGQLRTINFPVCFIKCIF